jgi:hypothetical protein
METRERSRLDGGWLVEKNKKEKGKAKKGPKKRRRSPQWKRKKRSSELEDGCNGKVGSRI